MRNTGLRLVYMGTPDFAVAPLKRLIDEGFNVVAVVTAPDRPAGRGKKLRMPAVKSFALEAGIEVLQPEKLRDPAFTLRLEELDPHIQVVVAFRMLPEVVWRIPSLGTFNLHASLLPQYRGAAPINHAIINGERETGATTFLIDEQIDTGNILLRESLPIAADETAGELHDRLMELGAELVCKTVKGLAEGSLEARSQDQFQNESEVLRTAPKIHKEDCRINWDADGQQVVNHIRGLSPYPGAFTRLGDADSGSIFKIFRASLESGTQEQAPGTLIQGSKEALGVAVRGGTIYISELQQEGKKRMEINDFLRGFSFPDGPARFF